MVVAVENDRLFSRDIPSKSVVAGDSVIATMDSRSNAGGSS